MPQPAGKTFLEVMKSLAKQVPNSTRAIKLLLRARDKRLRKGGRGRSRARTLTIGDVQAVLKRQGSRVKKQVSAASPADDDKGQGEKESRKGGGGGIELAKGADDTVIEAEYDDMMDIEVDYDDDMDIEVEYEDDIDPSKTKQCRCRDWDTNFYHQQGIMVSGRVFIQYLVSISPRSVCRFFTLLIVLRDA